MILKLYQNIAETLAAIPELNWIDLDKGQLETPQLFESLLSPAVIIGFEDGVKWQSVLRGKQTGQAIVCLKVVITLPQSTHYKPATALYSPAELLAPLAIEDVVHQKFSKAKDVSRIETKGYYHNTFYVIEHTYLIPYIYTPDPEFRIHHVTKKPHITTNIIIPR